MSHAIPQSHKKYTIYYDGSCPMCVATMGKVPTTTNNSSVEKVDSNHNLPAGVTIKDVQNEIYVIAETGETYRGIDGILELLNQHAKWRWLSRIGRLPIIHWLLQLGYKLVALNRHYIFGEHSRLYWLKTVTILGLLSGLLLSEKLWFGDRLLPKINFLAFFSPQLSVSLELVLLLILAVSLVVGLIVPRSRIFLLFAGFASVLLILFDQNRLQPWVYQYVVMLLVLSLVSWKKNDFSNYELVLNFGRLAVVSTYIFSGLQKLNLIFINQVFPWFIEPLTNTLVYLQNGAWLQVLALLTTIFEIILGIGLLTRYRNIFVWLAASMHVFILLMLGPLGHNFNSVVWPWNITMIALVFILFWRQSDFKFPVFNSFTHLSLFTLALILYILIPASSFFGFGHSYLSSSLYSGNVSQALIQLDNTSLDKLPQSILSQVILIDGVHVLDLTTWSYNELNVPLYPEPYVFMTVGKFICDLVGRQGVVLQVYQRSTWFNGPLVREYSCSELR